MDFKEIVQSLHLEPLPGEGGYFRQTYKAKEEIAAHGGKRALSSAIFYLLTAETFSALHRLKSDELWFFHQGDAAEMIQIDSQGELRKLSLGGELGTLQTFVPAGVWQGTRLKPGGKWALFSCTVAPGFEFEDSEVPSRAELTELFPQHKQLIQELTHS